MFVLDRTHLLGDMSVYDQVHLKHYYLVKQCSINLENVLNNKKAFQ